MIIVDLPLKVAQSPTAHQADKKNTAWMSLLLLVRRYTNVSYLPVRAAQQCPGEDATDPERLGLPSYCIQFCTASEFDLLVAGHYCALPWQHGTRDRSQRNSATIIMEPTAPSPAVPYGSSTASPRSYRHVGRTNGVHGTAGEHQPPPPPPSNAPR